MTAKEPCHERHTLAGNFAFHVTPRGEVLLCHEATADLIGLSSVVNHFELEIDAEGDDE